MSRVRSEPRSLRARSHPTRSTSAPRPARGAFTATTQLLTLSASLLLVSCSSESGAGRFSAALGARIQAHADTVDLSTIDGPSWDSMFVFESGTSRDENCLVLGLGWLECKTTMPAVVRPKEEFLVFMIKGRISSAQRHPESNGAFGAEATHNGLRIERNAARFAIVEDLNGPSIREHRARLRPIL